MIGSRAGAIESAEQLLGMWEALVVDYEGADAAGTTGCLARRWAGADFDFYNALSFADPDVGSEELLGRAWDAAAFMRNAGKPGYLWIFRELLTVEASARLAETMEAAGLVPAVNCWGMAGDLPGLEERSHPALRFERVVREDQLLTFGRLNARGYGSPEAAAEEAFSGSDLWRDGIHAYIGYERDEPVCCAGTYPVDGRLFVILVATDPNHQRRGFGEAVTRKAMVEGQKATGLTRFTLHATSAGRPVYERIGLTVTSEIPLFMLG